MISENLNRINALIREFELKYDKAPGSVRLLAVSKKQTLASIKAAAVSGQAAFGENYLQEALPKIAELPDVEWHFIGPIQRNKTRKIAAQFPWVQSVDNQQVALRLSQQRPEALGPLNICIEVNTSGEPTKSGISLTELKELAVFCRDLPNIKLRGLMTIPEPEETFEAQRQSFRMLKTAFDQLNAEGFSLDTLSMGMSNDFEAAIAEGSTMVRIGTAIFGPRHVSFSP